MQIERRNHVQAAIRNLLRLLLIIAAAFLINAIILAFLGKDVLEVYEILFTGAFVGKWNFARTLRWASPLLLTGTAAAIGFRGGVFNLGIDGQLYVGAFAAAWVGFTFPNLPGPLLIVLALLAAILAGALWAMIAGGIKIRFGASEVVITLMLNYVAKLFTEYLVMYPFYVPGTASDSKATLNIASQALLSPLIQGSQVTTALFISLAVVLLSYLWMHHTVSGFETKLVGSNARFAQFSGVRVKYRQLQIMALSGGLAGLCGGLEILGVHGRFVVNFTSGLGFDGITVALLSGNNPLAIPAAALFMGAMTSGSTQLEMLGGIPRSMASILMGIIIMTITIKQLPEVRNLFRKPRISWNRK